MGRFIPWRYPLMHIMPSEALRLSHKSVLCNKSGPPSGMRWILKRSAPQLGQILTNLCNKAFIVSTRATRWADSVYTSHTSTSTIVCPSILSCVSVHFSCCANMLVGIIGLRLCQSCEPVTAAFEFELYDIGNCKNEIHRFNYSVLRETVLLF